LNIRRTWPKLALLLAVAVVIGFSIQSTMAYVTARSQTLTNVFKAPYVPPETDGVEVHVHKTVHNAGTEHLSPEGFQFKLQSLQSEECFTLTADKDGFASVTLPFADAVLGKTYTYHLYEINDARKNVQYDDAVYVIQITPYVSADNRIMAEASVNGKVVQQIAVAFENVYNAGILPPATGDETPLLLYGMLMLISIAGMVFLLSGRRIRK